MVVISVPNQPKTVANFLESKQNTHKHVNFSGKHSAMLLFMGQDKIYTTYMYTHTHAHSYTYTQTRTLARNLNQLIIDLDNCSFRLFMAANGTNDLV